MFPAATHARSRTERCPHAGCRISCYGLCLHPWLPLSFANCQPLWFIVHVFNFNKLYSGGRDDGHRYPFDISVRPEGLFPPFLASKLRVLQQTRLYQLYSWCNYTFFTCLRYWISSKYLSMNRIAAGIISFTINVDISVDLTACGQLTLPWFFWVNNFLGYEVTIFFSVFSSCMAASCLYTGQLRDLEECCPPQLIHFISFAQGTVLRHGPTSCRRISWLGHTWMSCPQNVNTRNTAWPEG